MNLPTTVLTEMRQALQTFACVSETSMSLAGLNVQDFSRKSDSLLSFSFKEDGPTSNEAPLSSTTQCGRSDNDE